MNAADLRKLTRIDLELARETGHPDGDASDRYTILAPLEADGRIDAAAWKELHEDCRVVRETPSDPLPLVGHLFHGPGGRWQIRYNDPALPEETGFRWHDERFVAGEYVSLERRGETHVYRVTSTRPL